MSEFSLDDSELLQRQRPNETPSVSSRLYSERSPSSSDNSHVYILRNSCYFLPDWLLRCCFRRARLEGCDTSYIKLPVVSDGNEEEVASTKPVDEFRVFKQIFFILVTTQCGVQNNFFFVSMAIKMPGYPSFLLYFTTILYVCIYFQWLFLKPRGMEDYDAIVNTNSKDRYSKSQYYLVVGVLISIGGGFSQFADHHVSGSLQAIINQLTQPLTTCFAALFLKHTFSRLEIMGASIVFFAAAFPLVYTFQGNSVGPEGLNEPLWVQLFLLSDIPAAFTAIVQEKQFRNYVVDEIHLLAYTNLISLAGFLSMVPLDRLMPGQPLALTQASMLEVQGYAFQCFLGTTPLPPACEEGAAKYVLGFVVCIVILFYTSAVVVKQESAAFQALASSLVTPCTAIFFSSAALVGKDFVHPLDAPTLASIVIIPIGIIVYKWEELLGNEKEDLIPLIAPH